MQSYGQRLRFGNYCNEEMIFVCFEVENADNIAKLRELFMKNIGLPYFLSPIYPYTKASDT